MDGEVMSELGKIKIVTDAVGIPHVYVIGTDIELYGVLSCNVIVKPTDVPVVQLEIMEPEVEIKPKRGNNERDV